MATIKFNNRETTALKRFIHELNELYKCYSEAMNDCTAKGMEDRNYYDDRIRGMEQAFELLCGDDFVLFDDPDWLYKRHIAMKLPELETDEEGS